VIDDRHQVETGAADPVAERAAVQIDPLPLEDLGLPNAFYFFAEADEPNHEGSGLNGSVPGIIKWDDSNYDPNSYEEQTIYGTVNRAEFEKYYIVPEGADLRGARLNKVNAPVAIFRHASLVGADLEAARLMRSDFTGADFTAAHLEIANLNHARLTDARLVSADLQEAKLQGAQLIGTNMEGALKRFTNFNDAYMKDCTGCPLDW